MKPFKFVVLSSFTAHHLVWMLVAPCCFGATISVPAEKPTVQAGIDAPSNGDIVLVAPGVYRERIDFHGKAIALKSQLGPRVTTIDGQSSGTVITMQSSEGPGTIVQGFTITGGAAGSGAGAYILNAAPTIRGNIFVNNAQGGGGFGAAIGGFNGAPIIDGNEFVANTCDGQFLSGVLSFVNGGSSPQIYNNIVHDNDCRAINMTLPVGAAPIVFNNTIVRNRTGIYIDHRVPNTDQTYRNNVIAQNDIGLEVVFQITAFDATWTNNILFGNAADVVGTTDPTGANGNLKTDPRFVSAASNDFRLALGSPAVDAGTAAGLLLPAVDFAGAPRVQDGNGDGVAVVDIGAFEGVVAPPVPPAPVPIDSKTALFVLFATICAIAKRRLAPMFLRSAPAVPPKTGVV